MIPDNWTASGASRDENPEIEERAVTEIEVRGNDDGTVVIAGYASTFNDPYKVREQWRGMFDETILPGAWKDTISSDREIHLMVGHGRDPVPLAAKRAGTLRLSEDSHGLAFEATLNPQRSPQHANIAFAIESRAMTQMSVGMHVPEEGDTWNDARSERFISKAELVEISVLDRGANPNTLAMARNDEVLAELAEIRAALLERGEALENDKIDRHMQGLAAELARLNRRRYP